MSKLFSRALLALGVLVLNACVAGQSIDFKYAPPADAAKVSGPALSVNVEDRRPYVTTGEKTRAYIGHYRAGFGNTWAVTTQGDRPLAELLQGDLVALLKAKGLQADNAGVAGRTLSVAVLDWNFDTYINGKFWYELAISIKQADGTVVARQTFKDQVVIQGNVLTGAKYAFEDEMPKVYARILRRIVEEDATIQSALAGRS
jgi:hypothetical protein